MKKIITKETYGFKDHETGLNCVGVKWKFFGITIWERDFGIADEDAITRAETLAYGSPLQEHT